MHWPKIERLLAGLDLVLAQIADLERERDAVCRSRSSNRAGKMIQQLASLRGIGVQSATVLVREAFVRRFRQWQGARIIRRPDCNAVQQRRDRTRARHRKSRNRRLRTVMVELAWLWQRYQPGAAQVAGSASAWLNRSSHPQGDGGGARA